MSKKLSIYILLYSFLILQLTLSFLNLREFFRSKQSPVLSATSGVFDEESFWKSFLDTNPSYFPGFIELAKIQISNQQYNEASLTLNKAKEIDPNSLLIEELESQIKR